MMGYAAHRAVNLGTSALNTSVNLPSTAPPSPSPSFLPNTRADQVK